MPSNPNVTLGQLPNPFLGKSIDLTLSFDNTGDATGYGPFVVLFLDQTGADGDDGLTFANASYLGSAVTTTQIPLTNDGLADGSYQETITVHGGDYDVTVPDGFVAGDSLVVFELPFGSFVTTQPTADISVSVDSSNLADLNEPLNITTQGGFVFGDSQTGNPETDTILGSATSGSVQPQLVTLQKNYLGLEDETATGSNFRQQYEVVVNIAPGQTINDLDISDILPDTMQFVRVVSIEDKDGTVDPSRITEVSTPDDGGLDSIGGDNYDAGDDDVPVVGGEVIRRIDTVEGGAGDRDLVMTVEFFVPRLDAADKAIIDANTADDVFDQNESELGNNRADGNTWQPLDPRDTPAEIFIPRTANDGDVADNFPNGTGTENDGGDEFNNPDAILEEQAIAIQKSVSNVSGSEDFKPEDVLEYTIEFQVSDYFAFEDVIVNDTFSDGQRFDPNFAPVLTFDEHANPGVAGAEFSSTANLANNYTPVGNNPNDNGVISTSDFFVINETDINNPATSDGSGNTGLRFDVSGLLDTQNGQDNQLVGGGVPGGGFNGADLNNNPPLSTSFGGTTGTIKFRTVVQDTYSDNFPSGDPSVDSSDRLQNSATIDGAVLNVDNLGANGNREADDTSTEISIASGNLYKSIYAINGDIAPGADTDTNFSDGVTGYTSGLEVDPGDEVTYRLSFELPVSDVEQLKLTDFFPLPAYDVDELAGLDIADLNNSKAGDLTSVPLAGFSEYGPAHNFAKDVEGFALDSNANSFQYDFGTFDDPNNDSAIVDVLVTTTIQDEPVADGLVYTNQVSQAQQNTFNEPDGRDAIVQINLRQPDVSVAKDVVSVNNDTNGDRNALEAGDVVTFSVTLDNTGSSTKGAFDAKINDLIPQGFIVPTGGINVTAAYGDNTTINSRGGNLTFSNSVNNVNGQDEIEIELVDDGEGTASKSDDFGALEGANNPDKNQITVTYDLEVSGDLSSIYTGANSGITNTARATFANVDAGQKFPEIEDDAAVEVRQPTAQKKFVTSSEGSTNGQNVAIGEIVRYRLIAEMPEGVSKNVILQDKLPGGLRFLNDNTAKIGFVSTSSGLDSSTIADNHIAGDENNLDTIPSSDISLVLPDGSVTNDLATNSDNYGSGADVFFKLGDITNSDRDNTNEFAIVEFNALVDNRAGAGSNDAGNRRPNRVSLFSDDANGNSVEHSESRNVTLTIFEPQIAIDKQVEDPGLPGTFINTTSDTAVQADTGDNVTFQTTFTNAGTNATTAFDVVMTDALPAGLTLEPSSVNAVDSNGDPVAVSAIDTSNNTVTISLDELPVDETITVTYDANLSSAVTPEQAITSTAEVEYTSLPGTNGTTTNDTGSSNTDTSGAITGERNGDGGVNGDLNDYFAADTGHIQAPPIEPTKSIVATSEASTLEGDDGIVDPRDLTIGEVVRYQLTTQIPEGTIPDYKITDLLPEGLRYLDDGTTNISFQSNGGVSSGGESYSGDLNTAAASNGTLPAGAISGDGGDGFGSGEDPIFSLGDITNVDSDSDGESIVIEFNALVENVIANQEGLVLDNTFQVDTTAADATPQTSNTVSVEILEPVIDNLVFTPSPNTGDGNDTITFTATFSNTGNATAFNVSYFDFPVQLQDRNADNVVVKLNNTVLNQGTDYSINAGGNLDLFFAEIEPGEEVEITFEADIIDNISPDFGIFSRSDIRYSSLPGNGSTNNPTGSNTPGGAGASNGERNGNGGTLNNYGDFAQIGIATPGLKATKSIVATSEDSTAETDNGLNGNHRDVTIGEIVRYRLVVEIPEGTIENLQLTDSLPNGLTYLNDGSAEVALVADDPDQISSDNNSIGSIAGNENNLAAIDPTSSIAVNDGVFNLGTITNVDDDTHDGTLTPANTDNKEYAVVEFNALVNNIAANQDTAAPLANNFAVTADNANSQTSNDVTVEILEPEIIDVAKTATPTTGDADDTIAFTVEFSNTGATSAFDVNLTDDLAAGEIDNLDFNNITVTRNGTAIAANEFVNNSTANNFDISINEVAVGDNIEVSYSADIINAIDPDYSFDNTTDLTYSTLPGTGTASNPTGSQTPGASGDADGERNGAIGAVASDLNNYADSGTTTLNTPGLAATKSIVATSESATVETDDGIADPRDLTIGEVVRYRLLVEIPEGQINDLQLTDLLPTGLEYLNDGSAKAALVANDTAEISSTDPAIAIAPLVGDENSIDSVDPTTDITPGTSSVADGTELVFNLGDVLNNDDETYNPNGDKEYVVVEYNAVVNNLASTQDGTIDDPATARSTFSSDFTVDAANADPQTSNAVEVEVLEPEIIDVAQTISPTDADAEDTIALEVAFSNSGATTAYDVRVTDDLAIDKFNNLSNIIVTRNGTAIAASEFVNNSTATNLDLSINEVDVNDAIEVLYEADLINTIAPNSAIATSADVTYTTLPGSGTVNNATGSTTPSTNGIADEERNGDDGAAGALNNYADSDGASLTTPGLIPTMLYVSTSEPTTDDRNNNDIKDVAIGEVVRYRLLVDLPEGQINNLQVEDILPAGLKYLNDGSAKAALVADNLQDISFVDTNTNPPAIANPNGDPSVRIRGNQGNIADITPTKAINAQNAAGNAFDPATDTNPVFNLGNILNNDNETLGNNNKEYAVIEFNAIVENIAANQDGTTLANNFNITYDNNQSVTTANSVDVEIVEPIIDNVLKEASVEDADAGDVVDFAVTYTNTGNTSAFDVRLFDQPLNTELENVRSVRVASSTNTLDTLSNNSSSSLVDVAIASVAPGETITVNYQADLVADLTPGSSVTNTAEVTYTSLPNEGTSNTSFINPTGSDAPGVSGAPNGERNGNDVDGVDDATDLNNYGGISADSIDIISLSVGSAVFEDTNNNGVRDSGEAGIAGVRLELYDDNGDRILDTNNDPVTATTNADGSYIFTQIPSGNYQIVIPASNFAANGALAENTLASANVDLNDNQEDGDSNGSQTGAARVVTSPIINLAVNSEPLNDRETEPDGTSDDANDNDSDLTVDFGFVPVGQIRGNVSTDVNNDGTGDNDLPDVTLTLFDDNGGVVATVTTDENGNYTFANVTAGDYTVEQTQPSGYGDVTEFDRVNDGVNDNNDNTVADDNILNVSLAAKEIDTGNDFVEVEYGRIAGNVSEDVDNNDTGDRDLVGVDLELLNNTNTVIQTTQTDTNGNYEFTNLFPGQYKVRQINLTGYGDVNEFDSNTNNVLDTDRETANANNDNLLTIALAAGEADLGNDFVDELGHISGNVKSDDDDNGTGDTNLAGVTVELLDNDGGVVNTTTTDANGNYEFSSVLPGDYTVRQTNLPGYGDVTPTTVDVTLAAGETNTGNDFVDELGRIQGNVKVDDDDNNTGDRNLPGVTVELLDDGTVIDTTTTGADGNYEFSDVAPGDYQVRQVNLAGYGDVTNTVLDVTLIAGETNTGNDFVDELGRIQGNVKVDDDDNDTGDRNLAGVTVELVSNGAVIDTTTTDGDGNYEFSDLVSGDYRVRQTNLPGYGDVTPTTVDVTLAAGETNTGNDFIDELGRIQGNVKVDDDDNDTGDRNLAGVTVELVSNGAVIDTTTTDGDGNYEFSDLVSGDYRVRQTNLAGYGDVTPTTVDVTLAAGETNTNNDFIDELGRIQGNVKVDDDDNGTGDTNLAGVAIELLDNGTVIDTATTGADGNYEFSDVLPGDYTVKQNNLPGYGDVTPTTVDVTLAAGETNEGVNFVDELGHITGSVTADEDNNGTGDTGLEGVTVELLDRRGNPIATTITNDAGNYEFSDVLPGDYTVRQVNLTGYGDVTDTVIDVTIGAGETSPGNDFIDEEFGAIAGSVLIDNDNNDSGDAPLENVTINLFNLTDASVVTTTTDSEGNYEFTDITPGEYAVEQINFTGYGDVSDRDAGNPNRTTLILSAGATENVSFVDELGRIQGNVKSDDDNDDLGDTNLENVTVELLDSDGDVVQTTATNDRGNYEFKDLLAGDYTVKQTNLDGYGDVNELDSNQTLPLDAEAETADADNDNLLAVALAPGETDDGNDFIDEELGSLSGNVSQDTTGDGSGDTAIANVTLNLFDDTGANIGTTTTNNSGNYSFGNLTPGVYTVVETNPDGLVTVAENEGGEDNDRDDNGVLSSIEAFVGAGENDIDNDFVEAVPAEINGRVWGDRDRNGIEGTFEPGINGVTVELIRDGDVVGSTISDDNGVYQFTEVIPGDDYQVLFDSTSFPLSYQGGFTTAGLGDSTTDSDVVNADTGTTALFNLEPGSLFNDLDAGLLEPELNEVDGTASPDLLEGTAIGDAIAGYKGQDTLTGGDGNDRFIYTETSDGVDIITDFTTGEDQIDLSLIINEELEYTGTDAIADGLVIIEEYDFVGSMIQIDFDASNELLPKDVVFLDGVTNINPNTDLLF